MEGQEAAHSFQKDCDGALYQLKPEHLSNAAQNNLNKKAIAYIKIVVSYEIWTLNV